MSENRINVIDIVEKIKIGNNNAFDGIQIKDYVNVILYQNIHLI